MKIAAAQFQPFDENISANIDAHIRWTSEAASVGAELILFPEMSLTGYQIEQAHHLAFEENDERLRPLVDLSNKYKITIIAGAPIKKGSEYFIGTFIISPQQPIQVYTKQFLHPGEEKAFVPSMEFNPLLKIHDERISLAICADISHPEHAENASLVNTTLYLASIFYTPGGISEAYEQLSSYAKRFGMNILMSNYTGTSYGLSAAGETAYWNSAGQLLQQLNAIEEGILMVDI